MAQIPSFPEHLSTERLILRIFGRRCGGASRSGRGQSREIDPRISAYGWPAKLAGSRFVPTGETGAVGIRKDFLLRHLEEGATGSYRSDSGEKRSVGDSLGGIGIFHREGVAKTRICERECARDSARGLSAIGVSEGLRADPAFQPREFCAREEIGISGRGQPAKGLPLWPGRLA